MPSTHEIEKTYTCLDCYEVHREKPPVDRHLKSVHRRFNPQEEQHNVPNPVNGVTWSCAAFSQSWRSTFFATYKEEKWVGDICGYCGRSFARSLNGWNARRKHVVELHKFGDCGRYKYFRLDHYRRHLAKFHGAVAGTWTYLISESARIDQPPFEPFLKDARALEDSLTVVFPLPLNTMFDCPGLESYSVTLRNYISIRRLVAFLEPQAALMHMNVRHHSSRTVRSSGCINSRGHGTHLRVLKQYVMKSRLRLAKHQTLCHEQGISLGEIEKALQGMYPETQSLPRQERINHNDMLELRKQTLDRLLLQEWGSTRDRINNWLLHSLRSDEKLAQVHKSMLKHEDIDTRSWAQSVVQYWNLDEAATGLDVHSSLSAGAVASQQTSSIESGDFHSCLDIQDSKSSSQAESQQIQGSRPNYTTSGNDG